MDFLFTSPILKIDIYYLYFFLIENLIWLNYPPEFVSALPYATYASNVTLQYSKLKILKHRGLHLQVYFMSNLHNLLYLFTDLVRYHHLLDPK